MLLVGYSHDPLLQSICVYKPTHVILVLNAQYGEGPDGQTGEEFGQFVARCIADLPPERCPHQISQANHTLESVVLKKDHPEEVFRTLCQLLIPRLQHRECLVLDVTGGKKSMVAGAFLFGAFADVGVSYVDFDEYDPELRIPRGYTCRIGLLANPYHTLSPRRRPGRPQEAHKPSVSYRGRRETVLAAPDL